MSGKFIEFTNPVTGKIINKGSEFYKSMCITHYHYSCLMRGSGTTGKIEVNGEIWHFKKHFKNINKRSYVPVPKGTKRTYNTKRVRNITVLQSGDRETKKAPDESELYYFKEVGNFRMKYSKISDRLVRTYCLENK